eukprot:gene10702-1946_t
MPAAETVVMDLQHSVDTRIASFQRSNQDLFNSANSNAKSLKHLQDKVRAQEEANAELNFRLTATLAQSQTLALSVDGKVAKAQNLLESQVLAVAQHPLKLSEVEGEALIANQWKLVAQLESSAASGMKECLHAALEAVLQLESQFDQLEQALSKSSKSLCDNEAQLFQKRTKLEECTKQDLFKAEESAESAEAQTKALLQNLANAQKQKEVHELHLQDVNAKLATALSDAEVTERELFEKQDQHCQELVSLAAPLQSLESKIVESEVRRKQAACNRADLLTRTLAKNAEVEESNLQLQSYESDLQKRCRIPKRSAAVQLAQATAACKFGEQLAKQKDQVFQDIVGPVKLELEELSSPECIDLHAQRCQEAQNMSELLDLGRLEGSARGRINSQYSVSLQDLENELEGLKMKVARYRRNQKRQHVQETEELTEAEEQARLSIYTAERKECTSLQKAFQQGEEGLQEDAKEKERRTQKAQATAAKEAKEKEKEAKEKEKEAKEAKQKEKGAKDVQDRAAKEAKDAQEAKAQEGKEAGEANDKQAKRAKRARSPAPAMPPPRICPPKDIFESSDACSENELIHVKKVKNLRKKGDNFIQASRPVGAPHGIFESSASEGGVPGAGAGSTGAGAAGVAGDEGQILARLKSSITAARKSLPTKQNKAARKSLPSNMVTPRAPHSPMGPPAAPLRPHKPSSRIPDSPLPVFELPKNQTKKSLLSQQAKCFQMQSAKVSLTEDDLFNEM